jgi:hypothetical protein
LHQLIKHFNCHQTTLLNTAGCGLALNPLSDLVSTDPLHPNSNTGDFSQPLQSAKVSTYSLTSSLESLPPFLVVVIMTHPRSGRGDSRRRRQLAEDSDSSDAEYSTSPEHSLTQEEKDANAIAASIVSSNYEPPVLVAD